jgi:hypothetical protein
MGEKYDGYVLCYIMHVHIEPDLLFLSHTTRDTSEQITAQKGDQKKDIQFLKS